MATSRVTRAIAEILRVEMGRARKSTTWFGSVIGRSQSHASQVLLGNKAMSTVELELACAAFGLIPSAVMRAAEDMANDEWWDPVIEAEAG